MDIIKQAKELGHSIQSDECYKALSQARIDNEKDELLQRLIGDFNLKRMTLNNLLSGDDVENERDRITELDREIKELYKEIMSNENMIKYNAVKKQADALMATINNILMLSMSGEDPETADAAASCGGSCATCGGC